MLRFRKKIMFFIYFIVNIIIVLSIKSNVERIFDISISGNRSIEECISGKPYWDTKSELYITTSQLLKKLKYPVEEYLLLTEDGYLLTMHRIPGIAGAQPVLLKHGAETTSFEFVGSGKNLSLALVLADKGYDVWLGNSRGSTYSQCHTRFTTSDSSYWNFSWHDMGIYDLPTEISYITNITNQKIMYVGHSMGTTIFYVMAVKKPEVASKVKAMFALSNVVYISNVNSPIKLLTPFISLVKLYEKIMGGALLEERSQNNFLQKLLKLHFVTVFVGGINTIYSRADFLLQCLYHIPAGTSFKTLIHFLQVVKSGRFQHYDYGYEGNLRMYNTTYAPDYDLSKIRIPITIFVGDNDIISDTTKKKFRRKPPLLKNLTYDPMPKSRVAFKIKVALLLKFFKYLSFLIVIVPIGVIIPMVHRKTHVLKRFMDLQKFITSMSNKIAYYRLEDPLFNHLDFIIGVKSSRFLYPTLMPLMQKYKNNK